MAKTLVVMAGGAGSRYGGNKQLAELGPSGEILMEYSVYDALLAGFNKIIFVIRPGMEMQLSELLERMCTSYPDAEFICAEQSFENIPGFAKTHPERSKPLGTVHALLSAAEFIDGSFAVINADDYYGRQAVKDISDAMEQFSGASDAAMIVYSLKNTLSKHGAVTRGICDIRDDKLEKIREAYKVEYIEDFGIAELVDGRQNLLSENLAISMNLWAFHKDILSSVKSYFMSFLSALSPTDNKSECLLPIMAEDFIEKNIVSIKAYPTDCRWFGLTYKEDSVDAQWEIDKRHADGTYPDKLFA